MSVKEFITKSNDPPRAAMDMLVAVEGFIADCLDDEEVDASEGLTLEELRAIQRHLLDALAVFIAMYARIGKEI